MRNSTIEEDRRALLADLQAIVEIGELLVEDFAELNAKYLRLCRAGESFAPEFALLMKLLDVQARGTDDDSDADLSIDDGQEDDSDNHGFGAGDSYTWLRDGNEAGVFSGWQFNPELNETGVQHVRSE